MKKVVKRIVLLLIVIGLLFTTACSVSVGSTSGKDDYNSLFPDAVAERSGAYKTSNVGYKYSIPNYGEMMVYVDTSQGHKFVLDQSGTGGFTIEDKDGNMVLQVYAVTQDVYKMATAQIDDVTTVNGRDYFIHKDPAYDYVQLFSYMADCGLDLGFVLEVNKDETPFRLVAFRGQALSDSSSDIYAYKGTEEDLRVE